ncbi:MAG: AraC family transcriptional regulator [Bacteroidota bacterium]
MKVYPFKIPKKPKENIVLQIDRAPRFYDKLHQHEEIQLSYLVSGKGKLVVGNTISTFKPGNFIAIGSHVPHLFLSPLDSKKSHMVSIFFTKKSFGETFFENQEMQGLTPIWEHLPFGFKVSERAPTLKNLFLGLGNENKFHLFIQLLELLEYLTHVSKIPIIESPHVFRINKHQGERLQLIFDFVMQNFKTEIKLEQVAEMIHMSKNAFCRFFKQRTNKTFFQFLAEIRVQHACELIREQPDASILAVATQSGYNTLSNFNRQFQAIKRMNPSTYRNGFAHKI